MFNRRPSTLQFPVEDQERLQPFVGSFVKGISPFCGASIVCGRAGSCVNRAAKPTVRDLISTKGLKFALDIPIGGSIYSTQERGL